MNPQKTDINELVVLRTEADVNKFTGEEYRADLLKHFTPKTWEEICEDELEFLRICEEEEQEEQEEQENLKQELKSKRLEELESKRLEELESKMQDDIIRKDLKELTDIRKALFADGKYELEEGEILE